MMVSLAISPRAFLPPSTFAPEYFSLMIGLLVDLSENGIMIVDGEPNRITIAAITSALEEWPVKYRSRAKEILVRLRSHNRIIQLKSPSEAKGCENRPCRFTVGLARQANVDALLSTPDCEKTVSAQVPSRVEVFSLPDYQLSRFRALRQERKHVDVAAGELSQSDAETRLFEPVMRHAKRISIVDRYIGRSLKERGSLSQDYKRSLDWFCEMFIRKSATPISDSSDCRFEIWCGLDTRSCTPQEISDAVTELRGWEAQNKSRIPALKLWIKLEDHLGELRHARYMITNQVAVLVERGFDILESDSKTNLRSRVSGATVRRLRDCEIIILSNGTRALTEIMKLRDAT